MQRLHTACTFLAAQTRRRCVVRQDLWMTLAAKSLRDSCATERPRLASSSDVAMFHSSLSVPLSNLKVVRLKSNAVSHSATASYMLIFDRRKQRLKTRVTSGAA